MCRLHGTVIILPWNRRRPQNIFDVAVVEAELPVDDQVLGFASGDTHRKHRVSWGRVGLRCVRIGSHANQWHGGPTLGDQFDLRDREGLADTRDLIFPESPQPPDS